MTIGILGRKLGMTQVYTEEGKAVPVTVIQAGPCPVVDLRSADKNGYEAVLLGFGEVKPQNVTKPLKGIFGKANIEPTKTLREFRVQSAEGFSVGQEINVTLFEVGEAVHVSGISKGKGFAGVVKRFHFAGQQASHGTSVTHRRPGSAGSNSYPGHVMKGKRMPGNMGNEKVTVRNLTVVGIDSENNLLLVKGAVPGAKNSLVTVYKKS
jgi:large subunit ribosomal protein L3